MQDDKTRDPIDEWIEKTRRELSPSNVEHIIANIVRTEKRAQFVTWLLAYSIATAGALSFGRTVAVVALVGTAIWCVYGYVKNRPIDRM